MFSAEFGLSLLGLLQSGLKIYNLQRTENYCSHFQIHTPEDLILCEDEYKHLSAFSFFYMNNFPIYAGKAACSLLQGTENPPDLSLAYRTESDVDLPTSSSRLLSRCSP